MIRPKALSKLLIFFILLSVLLCTGYAAECPTVRAEAADAVPDPIEVSWTIGLVDTLTGDALEDPEAMRIVSNKIYAARDLTVTVQNPADFKYVRYLFDSTGTPISHDSGWSELRSFTVKEGQYLVMKVRENNYATWTPELMQEFIGGISFEYTRPDSFSPEDMYNRFFFELVEAYRLNGGEFPPAEPLTDSDVFEIKNTVTAIRKITDAGSDTAVICFPTDLHLFMGNTPQETIEKNTMFRAMLSRYSEISEQVDIDFTIFGGDYLLNNSTTIKYSAVNSLLGLRMMIDNLPHTGPVAVIKGNHDDNTMHTDYCNGYINEKLLWETLLSADADAVVRDPENLEKGYGYYDIPGKKLRVFFLNSSDVPTKLDALSNTIQYPAQQISGFSNEQLNFLAQNLYFDEPDWQVLIFCHHPPVGTMREDYGGRVFSFLLSAFENKEKGTLTNNIIDFEMEVSFDYTGNQSNNVIAVVCGHTHHDSLRYIGSIPCVSVTAASGGSGNYYNRFNIAGRFINYIVVDKAASVIYFIKDGTDYPSFADNDGSIEMQGDWSISYS